MKDEIVLLASAKQKIFTLLLKYFTLHPSPFNSRHRGRSGGRGSLKHDFAACSSEGLP
jgi:hypothetical protein